MSVPFANFSSQDRHKTQGTPAAVHSNPVLSMSLDHTWEEDQPQSGLVPPIQETLAHRAEKPKSPGLFALLQCM